MSLATDVRFTVSEQGDDGTWAATAWLDNGPLVESRLDVTDGDCTKAFLKSVAQKLPDNPDTPKETIGQLYDQFQHAARMACPSKKTPIDPTATTTEIVSAAVPVVVNLDDVAAEEIEWFWEGRVAIGKLTIYAGDPGLGKSFLTIDLASRTSTGQKWFDCDSSAPLGSTVILNAEDALGDTIKPRLLAAGADCKKVFAIQAVKGKDELGEYQRSLDLQRDLAMVEQTVESVGDCKLVVVDPLSAYLGKVDSHRNADVRSVLAPLSAMAEKHRVAVVAVDHLTKGETRAIYKVTGSIGFTGAARAVWAITRDKDDPTEKRRLFLPIKSNLAEKKPGLAFTLSAAHIGGGVPCVEWLAGEVNVSADEAMSNQPRRPGPDPEERHDAEAFLREALARGARPTKDIIEEAKEAHGITKITLDRARKAIKVEAFRDKVPGPWMLRLPTTSSTSSSGPRHKEPDDLDDVAYIPTKSSSKSVNGSNNVRLFESQEWIAGLPPGDDF